jgi:hypothetical protein
MRNMIMHRGVLVLIALLFASGCASYPTVTYLEPSSPDANGAIKYHLQGSLVTLGKIKSKKVSEAGTNENNIKTISDDRISINSVADFETQDVSAIVTATEAKKHFYAVKPHESMWTKTYVSVSYVDNTRLIKSIGTGFEDNRIKVIEALGGIIVTAAGISKSAAMFGYKSTLPKDKEQLTLPVVIDLSNIDEAESQPWKKISGYDKWWYKIELLKPENKDDDRMKLSDFETNIGKEVRYLAYSSCQDAKLKVVYSENQPEEVMNNFDKFELDLRIANPNYVYTLNFPVKGSISMHSICGADIRSAESKTSSNLDIAEALIKQADAIYKAQKKTK